MSYEQFWEGDPWMVRAYAQAYLLKRRVENENAWIQGSYIANAVAVAIANTFGKKRVDYIKKPFDLFPKTDAEESAEIREERLKVINFLSKLTMKPKETGSESDGKSRNP